MKQIVRAPPRTRPTSSSLASRSGEPRTPSASSSSGGFHIAMRRSAWGDPSRSTSATSSRPLSAEARLTGFATVADASRNRGALPGLGLVRVEGVDARRQQGLAHGGMEVVGKRLGGRALGPAAALVDQALVGPTGLEELVPGLGTRSDGHFLP